MLIGDVGQSNVEEINLGEIGGNYGWSKREGGFAINRVIEEMLYQQGYDTEVTGLIDPVLYNMTMMKVAPS